MEVYVVWKAGLGAKVWWGRGCIDLFWTAISPLIIFPPLSYIPLPQPCLWNSRCLFTIHWDEWNGMNHGVGEASVLHLTALHAWSPSQVKALAGQKWTQEWKCQISPGAELMWYFRMKRMEDRNLPWGGVIRYDADIWKFWSCFGNSTFQVRIWKYIELMFNMKQCPNWPP